ncbi:hypothetical protein KJ652_07455 [Patescibacteria group bacterium]|nr:hypothetical protein [Patescibacteria group bacterium]MBU1124382.1 hypothetical protein [Patescibacteria group bacterium]MBU1911198.1 hypothetical protein [Patescibacteria group bacterium]
MPALLLDPHTSASDEAQDFAPTEDALNSYRFDVILPDDAEGRQDIINRACSAEIKAAIAVSTRRLSLVLSPTEVDPVQCCEYSNVIRRLIIPSDRMPEVRKNIEDAGLVIDYEYPCRY